MVTQASPSDQQTALSLQVRRQVARWGCFPAQDFEDAVDEVLLKIYSHWPLPTPRLANPAAVLHRRIESILSNLTRYHRAAKRAPPCQRSLDELPVLADRCSPKQGEEASLRLDIARVLRTLPPELQELADYLQHHSLSEVSRILGIPRTTLRRRLTKIRERFREMGWVSLR